ncbi:MAG: glycosyltransferase family 2 protein [Bacteroidetes bacterium]|nr:glycosyltransferase family 2 protein [Bacteroidota bacterium]
MIDFAKMTLAVINSREKYIQECVNSLNRIIYPQMNEKIDIKIFKNYKKGKTDKNVNIRSIGEALNGLVEKAEGEWILFVGDDDMIARTLPFNYAVYLITYQEKHPKDFDDVVCVTGNMILINDLDNKREHLQSCPTGLWRREYLLKNKFDEKLKRYVDTDMFAKTLSNNKKILYAATDYGYYYRQHTGNVSGNKFDKKSKILKEIIRKNVRQKEIGGINNG